MAPVWHSPTRPRCCGGFVPAAAMPGCGFGEGMVAASPGTPWFRGGVPALPPHLPPLPGFFTAPSCSAAASPSPRGALSPHVMLAAPRGFPAPGSGLSAPGRGGGGRFGGAEPSPCTTGASPPATSCPVGAAGGSPVLPWVAGRPFAVSFRRFLGLRRGGAGLRQGPAGGRLRAARTGRKRAEIWGNLPANATTNAAPTLPRGGGGEAEGGSGHTGLWPGGGNEKFGTGLGVKGGPRPPHARVLSGGTRLGWPRRRLARVSCCSPAARFRPSLGSRRPPGASPPGGGGQRLQLPRQSAEGRSG